MRIVGLRRCSSNVITRVRPRCRLNLYVRSFASTPLHQNDQDILDPATFRPQKVPNPSAKRIAVLGGGITGLTAAYDLVRTIPHAEVTVYEKQPRLGGWLDSEKVQVDGGEVLFEWGPRNLRPDLGGSGRATINLIGNLKMHEEVIGIGKQHPSSTNRFVYYPDHLTRMPGPFPGGNLVTNLFHNAYSLFTEPIFSGAVGSLIAEPTVRTRGSQIEDESVGHFLLRRYGPTITNNLASALFHGIYAGDIYKLSARQLLKTLYYLETRDPDGSGVNAEMLDLFFRGQTVVPYDNVRFHNMTATIVDHDIQANPQTAFMIQGLQTCSVYTFRNGLGVLGQYLEDALKETGRVSLKVEASVESVLFNSSTKQLDVKCASDPEPASFDYVVSTLRPGLTSEFIQRSSSARKATSDPRIPSACEKANHAVNVMVVNLYYDEPSLIPPQYAGFGYLIPRSVAVDQNPERALGVIFGSESSGVRGPESVQTVPHPYHEQIKEMKTQLDKADAMAANLPINTPADLDEKDKSRLMEARKRLEANKKEQEEVYAKMVAAAKDMPLEIELKTGQDSAPGTKLTVMLGGHWWDGWAESDLPNEQTAINMSKTLLARHLKIDQQPAVAKAKLHRNAIPQYQVGYRQSMATIHQGLMDEYQGRMKVAGPWWQGGVGVNDCIKKARETALSVREQWDDKTGLEDYTRPEKWCLVDRRTGVIMMDPMGG